MISYTIFFYRVSYEVGNEKKKSLLNEKFTIYIIEKVIYCCKNEIDMLCSGLNVHRCDPYDPSAFKAWAMRGSCHAIPGVLVLFNKLIKMGFKVFLITGRDEVTLGQSTIHNLHKEGFQGYERLILRYIFIISFSFL